jgi:hypothetical protein
MVERQHPGCDALRPHWTRGVGVQIDQAKAPPYVRARVGHARRLECPRWCSRVGAVRLYLPVQQLRGRPQRGSGWQGLLDLGQLPWFSGDAPDANANSDEAQARILK